MHIHEVIFPSLKGGRWGAIDLDQCVRTFKAKTMFAAVNPYLQASEQSKLLAEMHAKKDFDVDYSYGGYMEDRSTLWRGHYHAPGKFVHLGIDFNVPAGTAVCLPFGGDVVCVGASTDQYGGWGGRLDFRSRTAPIYFIIAHLDPESIWKFIPSGQSRNWHGWYPQGHTIGLVGGSDVNGGWYPHVHLQCVSKEKYESYADPMDIDGYNGPYTELERLQKDYPNPANALKLGDEPMK